MPATAYLNRPDGRIAYDVAGAGPLVVLVPGMGELRSTYRFLAPALVAAGYRVACTDLRGHGDSDTTFASYGDVDTAGDVRALIEELGGPAVIVGNSMGAGAAVLVAAEHPELVSGLVLVGPWVRNGALGAVQLALFRMMMARPWAATAWKLYMPKLYAGRHPDDFEEYRDRLVANLHRPGYAKAFSLTTRTDHAPAEACLGDVTQPTMIIMGELDPDGSDPALEAAWIGEKLRGEVVMVPQAGHYPQSQQPEQTGEAVARFLTSVHAHA
ncbi:MAG: alpha/beta fold hydrolase [Acidimicrobiales bacterium]